ncbi:hypothetical protein IE53DRAFT_385420 [Violaceomyces palustris]|uniref:Uncharacterized protein n=1 Tax=Violaceomyces palustris TaxID=1673888 RepID=A0ACD0P2C2_9BASI|nr:hypothetical protein IE53DRAFT_385420 [Violaceomyces palustris]
MDLMGDSSFLAAANVSLGDDSFHVVGGAKVQASRGTRPGSAKCGSHPFLGGGRRQPPNSDRLPDPRTNARFQRESEGATSKRDSQNGKPASSVPTTDPQGKTAVRKKMEEKKEDRNGLGIGWANDSVDLSLTGRNVSHSNIFDESGERSLLFGSSFLSDVEGGSLAKAVEKQANGKEKGGKEDDGRGRRFTEREEKLSCSTSSDASFRSVETVTETDWRNGRSRSGSNASNLSNTSSIARPSGISRSESSSSVSSSSTVIVETGATPETQMRSKNPSCAAALPEAKTRRLSSVSATPSRIRGISKPPVSGTASRRESLIAQTQLQALESGLMATPVATLRGTVGTKSRRSSSPIGLGRTPTLSRREVKEKGETDATPLASRRIQSWQIDAVEVKATSSTPLTNRRSNSSSGSRTDLTTSTSRISRGSPLVHPRKSAPTIPSSRSSTSLITPSSSNSSISSIGTVTESTAATSGPRSRLGGLTSSRSVKPSIHQTTGLPRKLEPTTTSSIPAPTATSYLPKSSSGTLSSTRRPPSSSSLKQTEIGTRLARTKTTISKHDPVPTPTAPHSLSEQVLKESKSNNPPPPKRNEPNHQPLSKPKLPTTTTRVGGAIARSRSTAIPQRTKFGGGGGQGEEGEGERGKENRKEADSKSSEVMKTTIVSPPIPTSSSDGRAPSTGQSSSSSTPREVQVDRGRIAFGYRRRA